MALLRVVVDPNMLISFLIGKRRWAFPCKSSVGLQTCGLSGTIPNAGYTHKTSSM
jgi:hypothetical protein